jgi:hypothetical protein
VAEASDAAGVSDVKSVVKDVREATGIDDIRSSAKEIRKSISVKDALSDTIGPNGSTSKSIGADKAE